MYGDSRDGETRRKRRSERSAPPAFDALIEVTAIDAWRVHGDAAASVDALLEGSKPPVEVKPRVDLSGRNVRRLCEAFLPTSIH